MNPPHAFASLLFKKSDAEQAQEQDTCQKAHLEGSVTCLHLILQLSFSGLQVTPLLAQDLTLPCQLAAQLAVCSSLSLQQTLSLTQLSALRGQRLRSSLQNCILLLQLLALLVQLSQLQ